MNQSKNCRAAHRASWSVRTAAVTILLVVLCLAQATALAQAPAKPTPQTTADPKIPLDELNLLLLPLTKDELIIEADGWIGVLKTKTTEISRAEIAVKAQNKEMAKAAGAPTGTAGQPGKTEPDAAAQAKTQEDVKARTQQASKEKGKLLEDLNKLRDERTAIIDRVGAVLAALTAKGGDAAVHEKYVVAVSGITVDVKDASAAATAIIGWLKSPQGGLRWLKNIIFFALTLTAFKILSSLAGHAVRKAFSLAKTGSSLLQDFFVNSTRKVILILGVVVAVSMLEVNVGPLVAAIGAVGFVVGFALQGTLSNFAAGVMILLYRPYDLGDTVTVAGATGRVSSMTLVSTTVETGDKKLVVVPNSSIWGAAIHRHLPG